jgi:hypothetical protein
MRFTGVYINDIPLYEGNIVSFNGHNYTTTYDKSLLSFIFIPKDAHDSTLFWWDLRGSSTLKIIDNAHS